MALDISAIYQGQSQPDIGALYGEALKIKQLQTEQRTNNALKLLAQDPANMTDGLPNQNYLKKIAVINPEKAIQLQAQVGEIQHNRALTQEEIYTGKKKLNDDITSQVREPAVNAYNEALKASGGNPFAAQEAAQKVYDEASEPFLKGGILDSDQKAQWNPKFDLNRVQAAIVTSKPRPDPNTLASAWKSGVSDGRPARANLITGDVESFNKDFTPDPALGRETAGAQLLTDPKTNQQYWAYPRAEGGARYTDMEGKPYQPSGGQHIQSGRMYGGVAAAIAAAQNANIAAGKGPLTEAEVDDVIAREQTAAIAGAAPAKADAQSLANLTKINDSSTAFENTAQKNFDLALKLIKASPTKPNFGPWLNKWVQEGEIALGDPNMPPAVTALLTGANEYAKVMAGSTGSQGSTVDSRTEAREIFSPYLNTGQIEPVIAVATKDMENKKASYASQIEAIKARVRGDAPAGTTSTSGGGGPSKSAGRLPRDLPSAIGVPPNSKVKDKSGKVVAVMGDDGTWHTP